MVFLDPLGNDIDEINQRPAFAPLPHGNRLAVLALAVGVVLVVLTEAYRLKNGTMCQAPKSVTAFSRSIFRRSPSDSLSSS